MSLKFFARISAISFLLCTFSQGAEKHGNSLLEQRSYFSAPHPRLIWFRGLEQAAYSQKSLEEIEPYLNTYNAAVAKAFDEEKYGLSKYSLEYYREIKKRHPNFLLILHYNGASRDPRDGSSIFPGHWLHRVGCRITSDIAAQSGISEINVEDTNLFSMTVGKIKKYPDNMTICELNNDGTPNWLVTEYVKLVEIDAPNKRLKIKRAFLNSKPKQWKANQTYIAPIASHGRWTLPKTKDEPLNTWRYNFCLDAPRDSAGRTLIDFLVDDLAGMLNPGGPGDFFDGVTFDVMPFFLTDRDADPDDRNEGFKNIFGYYDDWDTNGDGKKDFADSNGVDRFAAGVSLLHHRLREKLGPNKLIMMDSGRRANQVMNGIESEGWPIYNDLELNEWSSGMNFHLFWESRGAQPHVRYIHRYGMPPILDTNSKSKIPRNYPRARLIMAASMLLGSALVTQHNPPAEEGELFGCFDELKMGLERRYNWLGMPKEDIRQLALDTDDLLDGEGVKITKAFQRKFSSKEADITLIKGKPAALQFKAKNPLAKKFEINFSDIPVSGSDIVIALSIKADPMRGMADDVARRVTVKLSGETKSPTAPKSLWTWADGQWFDATFYFRDLKSKSAKLIIECEDSGAVYINKLMVYGHSDVMCREFDHGLILANPGLRPFKFDLSRLYPSGKFRFIKGSPSQDPKTNTGLAVDNAVTVSPRDGLFLVRESSKK